MWPIQGCATGQGMVRPEQGLLEPWDGKKRDPWN